MACTTTVRIDGLGNILADADKNDASIFADEMMAIADKHGFQPATVAEVQQANYLHQRSKDFYNPHAQDIRARWARGIFENSPAQIESARLLLDECNVPNPDQRSAATAPKAMWALMRREVEGMREGEGRRNAAKRFLRRWQKSIGG